MLWFRCDILADLVDPTIIDEVELEISGGTVCVEFCFGQGLGAVEPRFHGARISHRCEDWTKDSLHFRGSQLEYSFGAVNNERPFANEIQHFERNRTKTLRGSFGRSHFSQVCLRLSMVTDSVLFFIVTFD